MTYRCPHDGCGVEATSTSGRTRHMQAAHPERLAAMLRESAPKRYPVERRKRLCVHVWSEGGDIRVHDAESDRWMVVHARTCKRCYVEETVRPASECTPMNCVTQRRLMFGYGDTK